MTQPTLPRLSNVILRVSNLVRALRFWHAQLGLPLASRGGPFAFLDAGATAIVLNEVEGVGDAGGGLAALTEVVLEVPDVLQAHALLASRGVVFRTAPRPVTGDATRELWACDARDPDGHLVSITSWRAR
jgi:catechol 2,3-dioxygenase-like lactoylglutathione lyase family enzyme